MDRVNDANVPWPLLGFGAFKIGRNQKIKYPTPYDLPDETQAAAILNGVLDLGITHIDTAPAYGLSEERIGRHLASRRSEFVLTTKVGEWFENGESTYRFDAPSIRSSVERSLSRLRTDAVDCLFAHLPANDVEILHDTPLVETLLALRNEGKTRAIGFSGKTPAGGEMALDWADALMVEYHARDLSHQPLIEQARRRGVPVLVKKGLAAGHIPASEAIPFVLQTPGVSTLVVGGLSLEHLRDNLEIARACQRAN
jgi:aryl-alcohol dehydrogenase-like predicted oxidoreductase